jgi:hypothetical protein
MVNFAAERKNFEAFVLDNDFHFQEAFDYAFPHFHFELCQKPEIADRKVQIYLVRSPGAWAGVLGLYSVPPIPYIYAWNVYTDGSMYVLTNEHTPRFTPKTWFILLGVADPQRRELEYEEDYMGPAPLGKDKLRVTRCSFFRRYIPDNIDVEFRGSAAPFTLVPTASVFYW